MQSIELTWKTRFIWTFLVTFFENVTFGQISTTDGIKRVENIDMFKKYFARSHVLKYTWMLAMHAGVPV